MWVRGGFGEAIVTARELQRILAQVHPETMIARGDDTHGLLEIRHAVSLGGILLLETGECNLNEYAGWRKVKEIKPLTLWQRIAGRFFRPEGA